MEHCPGIITRSLLFSSKVYTRAYSWVMNPRLLQLVLLCLSINHLLHFSITTASIRPLLPCSRRKQLLLNGEESWSCWNYLANWINYGLSLRGRLCGMAISPSLSVCLYHPPIFICAVSPRCLASLTSFLYSPIRISLAGGHGVKVVEVFTYLEEIWQRSIHSNLTFSLGMLGVPWPCSTETSSLPIRTKGASVAITVNW